MSQDNTKNDYSFITDQPGPDLGKPKRSKKPLIIIIGAVAVFALLIIIAVSKKSTNVQQQVATGQEESEQFLTLVADGKSEEAYNMYELNSRPDKEIFAKFATEYPKGIDLKNCALKNESVQITTETSLFVYRCYYFSQPHTTYIELGMLFQQINGKKQLTHVELTDIKT